MINLSEWKKEEKSKEERYLEDVDTCIRLLETLKEDYFTPGIFSRINTSKVSRVRITVHDLLKKY